MPKLLPRQYAKVLYALTDKVEDLDLAIKEFIKFLKKNQALSKVDYIIREFESYAKEQAGITSLQVSSVHKLDNNVIEKIKKAFAGEVEIEESIDESLQGGVVVKTKDVILDGSLRTQLENLKQSLI